MTADILYDFPVAAPREQVFSAVATPSGIDKWWTNRSIGIARTGATWELGFGEPDDWLARVTAHTEGSEIEWELIEALGDWRGTRVGLILEEAGEGDTSVRFHHRGWRQPNAQYRTSSFCWAMYLRLLKRYLEHGEVVEYSRRLEV